jgi:hypothetical protein
MYKIRLTRTMSSGQEREKRQLPGDNTGSTSKKPTLSLPAGVDAGIGLADLDAVTVTPSHEKAFSQFGTQPGIDWGSVYDDDDILSLRPGTITQDDITDHLREFSEQLDLVYRAPVEANRSEFIPPIVINNGWVVALRSQTSIINLVGGPEMEDVEEENGYADEQSLYEDIVDTPDNRIENAFASLAKKTAEEFEAAKDPFSPTRPSSLLHCKADQLSTRFALWAQWIAILKTAIDSVVKITAEFHAIVPPETIQAETSSFLAGAPTTIADKLLMSIDNINTAITMFTNQTVLHVSATTFTIVGYLAYKPFLDETLLLAVSVATAKTTPLENAIRAIDEANVFISNQQMAYLPVLDYANNFADSLSTKVKLFVDTKDGKKYFIVPEKRMSLRNQLAYLFTQLSMWGRRPVQPKSVTSEIKDMRDKWGPPDTPIDPEADARFVKKVVNALERYHLPPHPVPTV